MQDLKKGDIIGFADIRNEVLARIESVIFIRRVYGATAFGPVEMSTVDDLVTYGFELEKK